MPVSFNVHRGCTATVRPRNLRHRAAGSVRLAPQSAGELRSLGGSAGVGARAGRPGGSQPSGEPETRLTAVCSVVWVACCSYSNLRLSTSLYTLGLKITYQSICVVNQFFELDSPNKGKAQPTQDVEER